MKSFKIYFFLLSFFLCQTNIFSASAGFSNDISDARSMGNGNAVVARPLSPATNWYNPAGLTELEDIQISATIMSETTDSEFDSDYGVNVDSETGQFFIPAIFTSYQFKDNIFFGFGINAAYGLSTEWDNSITNYVATKSEFTPVNFNPNIAYKINDSFSAAFGLDISYATGKLQKNLNQTILNSYLLQVMTGVSGIVYSLDGESTLEGDDVALGWNTGFLYKFNDTTTLGLTYRSEIKHDLDGDVKLEGLNGLTAAVFGGTEYEVDASLEISIPDTLVLGIASQVTDKTSIELDFELARWSQIKQFNVKYKGESDPVRLSILNSGNPVEKDWDDTLNIALGVEHQLNSKNSMYLGTRYRPSPIPEENFDPSLPSCDLFDILGGFSIENDSSRWDFSMAYVWGLERDIDNTIGNDNGTSINGKYSTDAFVIGVTYTIKL